jgi:hypothetical protein
VGVAKEFCWAGLQESMGEEKRVECICEERMICDCFPAPKSLVDGLVVLHGERRLLVWKSREIGWRLLSEQRARGMDLG